MYQGRFTRCRGAGATMFAGKARDAAATLGRCRAQV